MPDPNPVTDLAISQVGALATLTWDHDGANLDRFQVLYKRPGSDNYSNLGIAPEADYGTGPYEFITASGQGFRWKILALNTAGARSETNPTVVLPEDLDGVWLIPVRKRGGAYANKAAYLRANPPGQRRDREYASFDAPFDVEGFSRAGVLHLPNGEITGDLLDRHSIAPEEWNERLVELVRSQGRYEKVMLASSRDFFPVELTTGLDVNPHPDIPYAYRASVPYRQRRR